MKTSVTKSPAKATTTKIVKAKNVKISKFDKLTNRINELKAKEQKEGLNLTETKSLVNCLQQIEDKSPSQVFNKLNRAKGEIKTYIKQCLGKSSMPSYNEFKAELEKKNKQMFSLWDGLNVLGKFNKLAATKTKVERQNKAVASK